MHSPTTGGVVCREKVAICDIAELCNGVDTSCPSDSLEPLTSICRVSTGSCDIVELCTGNDAQCPPNDVVQEGTICFAATVGAQCDEPERCNGIDATCPGPDHDEVAAFGVVCREAALNAGGCDVVETCSGTSKQCPSDDSASDGASCDDTLSCTTADVCVNRRCLGVFTCTCTADVECDDLNVCTADSCVDGACQHKVDQAQLTSPCSDFNACTSDDVCTVNGCVGVSECPECGPSGVCCAGQCHCTSSFFGGSRCTTHVDPRGAFFEWCDEDEQACEVFNLWLMSGTMTSVRENVTMHIEALDGANGHATLVQFGGVDTHHALDDSTALDALGEALLFTFSANVTLRGFRVHGAAGTDSSGVSVRYSIDDVDSLLDATGDVIDLRNVTPSVSSQRLVLAFSASSFSVAEVAVIVGEVDDGGDEDVMQPRAAIEWDAASFFAIVFASIGVTCVAACAALFALAHYRRRRQRRRRARDRASANHSSSSDDDESTRASTNPLGDYSVAAKHRIDGEYAKNVYNKPPSPAMVDAAPRYAPPRKRQEMFYGETSLYASRPEYHDAPGPPVGLSSAAAYASIVKASAAAPYDEVTRPLGGTTELSRDYESVRSPLHSNRLLVTMPKLDLNNSHHLASPRSAASNARSPRSPRSSTRSAARRSRRVSVKKPLSPSHARTRHAI